MRNSPSPELLRGCLVPVHCVCPCVFTYLYRFSVDAEYIFPCVNGGRHILADFLGQLCCQLTTGVELSGANQVWQVVFAFMVQTIKQIVLIVNVERLGCYVKSDDLQIGKLGNSTSTRHISESIAQISGEIFADSEVSDEICYEVVHKQMNRAQAVNHYYNTKNQRHVYFSIYNILIFNSTDESDIIPITKRDEFE